jgi:hypothetical protein
VEDTVTRRYHKETKNHLLPEPSMARFLAWRLTLNFLIQLSWPVMILFQPYVAVHECLTVTSLQFVNGT